MEIRSLARCDFDTLFRAFERAFSDYAISFDKAEVCPMLTRRGYVPHLSFGAFDGDDLIAFTLNGIGEYDGILTAYDTGTGTAAEYRGLHLASEIFQRSLPALRAAGIRQYLLEVLQENAKAISVYTKLGFEVTREFECFRQSLSEIRNSNTNSADIEIKPIDIETVRRAQTFCDFTPSWQNSMESIKRGSAQLSCLGAFQQGELAGFCVFDPSTGDLTQIAIDRKYRRKGIASQLLSRIIPLFHTEHIKVLNICIRHTSLISFLESKNIARAAAQYEMRKSISNF